MAGIMAGSMYLRRIGKEDWGAVAEFLDARTAVLRWLVAFFRHAEELPEGEAENWSLWRDEGSGVRFVAAHFYHNATTYLCADDGVAWAEVGDLLEEELMPERVIADAEVMERWRGGAAGFFDRAVGMREIEVLAASDPVGEAPAGVRRAEESDLPVLGVYGRMQAEESGEEGAGDFETLVSRGLVFVVDVGGRVAGFVRSNLPDGRDVHAGGLYIHPLFRGKGAGRALAKGLAGWVRAELGHRVVLDVFRENVAAMRAYEAAGYRRIGGGVEVRFDASRWGG